MTPIYLILDSRGNAIAYSTDAKKANLRAQREWKASIKRANLDTWPTVEECLERFGSMDSTPSSDLDWAVKTGQEEVSDISPDGWHKKRSIIYIHPPTGRRIHVSETPWYVSATELIASDVASPGVG